MTQPPPGVSGGSPAGGHPEPEPVPEPEPEPPQPIPPPDPVPAPSPLPAQAQLPGQDGMLAPPIWTGPAPQYPQWQVPLAPAQPKRRAGLWVALALTAIVLLCGGGAASAYFLISNADTTGTGAKDPAAAVNQFMTAVYTQQDPDQAFKLVCRQARDQRKLEDKIKQIKTYADGYAGAQFRWSDPEVSNQTRGRAVVHTTLTFSTSDEKQSQQSLGFVMIHKGGWQVCDVTG